MIEKKLSHKVFDLFLENIDRVMKHGLVIADLRNTNIIYMNAIAKKLLYLNRDASEQDSLLDLFGKEEAKLFLDGCANHIFETDRDKALKVSSLKAMHYLIVSMEDCTELLKLKEKNRQLSLLNEHLRGIYEVYSYDTLCITDEKGIVEFSGEACERHCGMTHEEIIGRDMHDLERDKVFYPAVTPKVIRSQKPEIVMQDTMTGATLCTVGIPVFDDQGHLDKVISISRDFANEIQIAKRMIDANTAQNYKYENARRKGDMQMITCSESIVELMQKMQKAANTNVTILIDGQTGTGKTLFASYIHKMSKRSGKAFVSVNCGSIPENLIESELFGYEQGAFTGADRNGKPGLIEMAQDGTIFFDEIGELPIQSQVKLLHILQEKALTRVGGRRPIKLNVRVVAATNKNLAEMVEAGTFREDLFYRLNVISFTIPPLLERRDDVPLLVTHFMNKYNQENDENKEITERAIQYLRGYNWPGNIRELENLIEMLCVTAANDKIDIKDLPSKIFCGNIPDEAKDRPITVRDIVTIKDAIADVEKQLIKISMEKCGSNHQRIANLLGVDRSTITRKINAYGLK